MNKNSPSHLQNVVLVIKDPYIIIRNYLLAKVSIKFSQIIFQCISLIYLRHIHLYRRIRTFQELWFEDDKTKVDLIQN